MSENRTQPGPGQESVWDYPRPPRAETFEGRIRVVVGDRDIADTARAIRVLETSHPPVYYVPPQDVRMDCLLETGTTSFCEWKGTANYFSIVVGDRVIDRAAWSYPSPTDGFRSIAGYIAFYAGLVDACYVNGESARPQPGGFYGGWVTSSIVGPFKGEPGSTFW